MTATRGGGQSFGDGRYQVVEVLGAGAMGIVYKAFDSVVGRHVAIKTISTEGIPPEEVGEFLRMFQAEAQAAGRLDHPGIVTVYDFNPSPEGPYIVMSLVEGGTLSGVMAKRKLEWEEVLELGIQVAEALEYAHQHGIQAHRDIKPGNIFVTAEGRYKVGDFGVAHLRKTVDEATHSTFFSGGTPRYMSPEQVATPRKVDGRSDMFSLCVVLYEALTGQLPYQGVTLNFDPEEQPEVAQRIVTAAYARTAPLRKVMPNLPVALAQAIDCGIHPDPTQRYRSCGELANVLRRAADSLKGTTISHHPRPLPASPSAPLATTGTATKVPVPSSLAAPVPEQKGFNWLTLLLAGILAIGVWQLWPRLKPATPEAAAKPGALVDKLRGQRRERQGKDASDDVRPRQKRRAATDDEEKEAATEGDALAARETESRSPGKKSGKPAEAEANGVTGELSEENADGRSGAYFVPAEGLENDVPLMVLLHGNGGSGREILRQFKPLAQQHGFAIVAPDSHLSEDGRAVWQVGETPDDLTLDVDHARACVRELLDSDDFHIDPGERLAVGYSGGGAFAAYLASIDPSYSGFAVLRGEVDLTSLGPRRPPGFISAGNDDRDSTRGRTNVEKLEAEGFQDIEFQEFSGSRISEDEMSELIRWWLGK